MLTERALMFRAAICVWILEASGVTKPLFTGTIKRSNKKSCQVIALAVTSP